MKQPAVTAQVSSGDEAFVAYTRDRAELGPNDEVNIAEIWHTTDRGRTWQRLPWRRALRTFVSRALIARWPPEWVNKMWLRDGTLEIEVRQDEGMSSASEPIWRAIWRTERWHVRFDRLYRVEVDGPIVPDHLELDLPGITTPPVLGPFR